MRIWKISNYKTWQLYGHTHGTLVLLQNKWEVGLDGNDFYPISYH